MQTFGISQRADPERNVAPPHRPGSCRALRGREGRAEGRTEKGRSEPTEEEPFSSRHGTEVGMGQ